MDIEGAPLQSAVGISHIKAGRAAADYLANKGYKKPSYVGTWSERPERLLACRLAFEARLLELGVPLVTHQISEERSSALVGSQVTKDLIEAYPEADCIFYANDDLALGGLFHAMSTGLKVPDDLAVFGFNGIEIGKATPIRLSSIETPRFDMGTRAAELLLSTKEAGPQVIDLDFEVFEGDSA